MAKIKLVLRIIVGLLLSALSAGLLLLSLPPYGLWPLALIGLAPLLFAQYRILPVKIANLAPAIGIGGFIGLVVVSHFPTAMIDQSPFLKFLTPGVMLVVNFLFTGPLLVGIPILADQRLAEGAAAFGLLMAASAAGNLVGYILAGALPKLTGSMFSLVTVALIASFGIALAAFGWIVTTWVDFVLMLALGIGNSYISLVIFTRVQQSTPREMLGRVMSMMMLASMGLIPLSQAISGAVAAWNLTVLFALAGGLLVLVAIWLAFNPGLKTLSDKMIGAAATE